jgi:predicted nucleic acid-binding protein
VLPTLRHRRPVTHNYVLVEAVALVQARLGMEAVRRLLDDLVPVVELRFVDRQLHGQAVAALLATGARDVSLVDRVSALMRTAQIVEAFAFDPHFEREGFTLV